MITDRDLDFLRQTLTLAQGGRFHASPNPMVGALVVRDERVLGSGFHRRVGGPHGEIDALEQIDQARAAGATLYVNLEPCRHQGRTPPCTERLIAAGLERVVFCHHDANPEARGGGERLARSGIVVDCLDSSDPVQAEVLLESVELNCDFLVRQVYSRPSVTLKWAMTIDGRIATGSGESQWISSPEGRAWALEQRELHDAILVGSGTVLADDPRLNRRLGESEGEITRVLLDRRLRVSARAALFDVAGPVMIFTERPAQQRQGGRALALEQRGAEIIPLERVDPPAVVAELARRGISSLLVEGGAEIHGAFVDAECWDRLAVCCAARLVGGARAKGPVAGSGFSQLQRAPGLARLRARPVGPDIILEGVRQQCLQDLLRSVAGS